MIIVVDDIRECVTLAGLRPQQFVHLAAIIRLARHHHKTHIRRVAEDLHLSCPFVLREGTEELAVMQLSWEQIFMLNTILIETLCVMGPERRFPLTDQLLSWLTVAVKSGMGDEGPTEEMEPCQWL